MKRTKFSSRQLRFLQDGGSLSARELHETFVKKFGRHDISEPALYSHAWRLGFRRKIGDMHKEKPIGRQSIRGGYVYLKISKSPVNETHIGKKGWVLKHQFLWEKDHGPIPKGHVLKCIDGDCTNTTPSNWECVPNGVVSRLKKRRFRDAPAELKPTILAITRLEHQLHAAERRP